MTGFRRYAVSDKQVCLALFDSNGPEFFDSTERVEKDGFAPGMDKVQMIRKLKQNAQA